MIELRDVHKRFGEQVILNGVNFTVNEGETVALLGPSGTGKSVLLKHIIGLIHPDSGTILVDGLDVSTLSRKALAALRMTIGYVFQNGALFDSMNVFENIRLGITDPALNRDNSYCAARVPECLGLVNLAPEVAGKYPAELSGGMRKRVALARAIALDPDILLFDEPTTGLDPVMTAAIDQLIMNTQKRFQMTCVVISHDIQSVFRIAHKIAMLYEGRIVEEGVPEIFRRSKHEIVQDFLSPLCQ